MKCRKLPPRLPVLGPLKNLENLCPVDISTSPSRALPSQTSESVFCIYLQICYLLLAAGLARGGEEGGAGLLTIYQTCPLVFILQY